MQKLKYNRNPDYRSLGASGAVSAVVFAYILFNPMQGIGLLFIPIFIPGFLFGILFLIVWIIGKRIDDRFKITDKTKKTLVMQFNKW